ncbi:hypothetical protein M407DRAFT_189503 [Tulasnella calospora MUT 4182]|uniref:Uncharacterized protein n=1 Tax=Tulasnella calospora MUT 4182 TaxID=1051891 RepID=A0A0C3L1M3_9AGAM|nr:hypothetical protein M407DRAFT_189503 [Tulasnella calospora MUT 4182]
MGGFNSPMSLASFRKRHRFSTPGSLFPNRCPCTVRDDDEYLSTSVRHMLLDLLARNVTRRKGHSTTI